MIRLTLLPRAELGKVRDAFIVGGSSTHHTHIRQHYEVYKKGCAELGIDEQHHALPQDLWQKLYGEKENVDNTQVTLDGIVEVEKP